MSEHDASFGDLRALLHQKPSSKRWQRLLAMLRDWPVRAQLEREVVPYVSAHLDRWPMQMMGLSLDRVWWCDDASSEVMLRRWTAADSGILPLVAEDAKWLRHVLRHLDYDVEHATKLKPLIHVGAFSRVRSMSWVHHENPKRFLAELQRVLAVRGGDVPLERFEMEACFFHEEAVERLMSLIDVSRLHTLAINHSIKPSAIPLLCEEVWAGVKSLELTGDLLRLEDARVLLKMPLCQGLERLRVGYLLDARGDEVLPLVREIVRVLERAPGKLHTLALPGMHITPEAIELLARSDGVSGVRVLDLKDNQFSVEAMRALCDEHSKFGSLEHLRLGSWWVQGDVLEMLLASPFAKQLKTLDVMRCGNIKAPTHLSLLSRKHMPNLENLALSNVTLSRAFFSHVGETQPEGLKGFKRLVLHEVVRPDGTTFEDVLGKPSSAWWHEVEHVEVFVRPTRASWRDDEWVRALESASHQRFEVLPSGERPGRPLAPIWRGEFDEDVVW